MAPSPATDTRRSIQRIHMTILRLHRIAGAVFAPFLIFAALTAIPLFWRKDGLYSESAKEVLVSLHTWEIGAQYIGIVLALALLTMSISGMVLFLNKGKEEIEQ